MNSRKIIARLKFVVPTLVLISISLFAHSQEPIDEFMIDSLIDDLFFNEDMFVDDILESAYNYNLLYLSGTFNSNTYISGRDTETDQINITPQISFFSSKGLTASISGIYYNQNLPQWGYTNLSLGYFNYLGKKQLFNYSVRYSRYFYGEGYNTLTNTFDVNFGIKNNKRTLGTKIFSSCIFGNGYSFQFISKSYASISLVKKNSLALKLRPELSFIFADRTLTTAESVPVTYFGLLYSQINVPINLLTKSWDLELAYNLNLPIAHELETSLSPTGFFSFTAGFLIDFTK